MGQIKYTRVLSEEEQRKRLQKRTPILLDQIEELVEAIKKTSDELLPLASPGVRNKYTLSSYTEIMEGIQMIRKALQDESDLDKLSALYLTLYASLQSILQYVEESENEFRINIDPETGVRTLLEFKSQYPSQNTKPLAELNKLANLPSLNHINISKDLVSSEFQSGGDILQIGTEADKAMIAKLQSKGKLLFGTMEGLSGGSAFFKSVSIALAKILNEQSKYYSQDPQRDKLGGHLLSGIPRDKIKEVFGESAKLEKGDTKVPLAGEQREFPYILLSYERLAKEVSKTGKISGGKDIEVVRLYINGGYREFETDPKTGQRVPVKSSYVPGLTSRKYPVSDGKGHFIFLPFVVNEGEIVDTSRKDPEVGCLLRLSPQYSKTLRGYTSLRGDTIQLIGGGRQKEITMDILSWLAFSRNTSGVLRKNKTEILKKYRDRPNYKDQKTGKRRVKKLEEHFSEAIRKSVEAKILLPGTDSKGELLGYREEINSGGEVVSVFIYNPDYLKGVEVSSDVQSGGE